MLNPVLKIGDKVIARTYEEASAITPWNPKESFTPTNYETFIQPYMTNKVYEVVEVLDANNFNECGIYIKHGKEEKFHHYNWFWKKVG